MNPPKPSRLSHYELLNDVGVGGMGTVYRARDTRNDAIVAVKVLHPHLSRDPDYVRRFQREVRIVQRIDSPRVVRVLDSGADRGSHFLVMEYIAGKTLAHLIQERGRLSVDETVSIAKAIAEALQAAHEVGVIHRDISPQNVMLDASGAVKVTDFGVARDTAATAMTATSMLLGKPQYIAPEVVTGQSPVDIRSDIYAVGVVMYQMLAGRVPFDAETPFAVMQKQVYTPAPAMQLARSDVPQWLQVAVQRCLAKNAAERYQTPGALLAGLTGGPPTAGSNMTPARMSSVSSKGPGQVAPAGWSFLAVVLVAVTGLAIALGSIFVAAGSRESSGDDGSTAAGQASVVPTLAPTATPRPTSTLLPTPSPTPVPPPTPQPPITVDGRQHGCQTGGGTCQLAFVVGPPTISGRVLRIRFSAVASGPPGGTVAWTSDLTHHADAKAGGQRGIGLARADNPATFYGLWDAGGHAAISTAMTVGRTYEGYWEFIVAEFTGTPLLLHYPDFDPLLIYVPSN